MNDQVYLALIVAIPTFLSPLIMAWLTSRNLRKVKEQDWARQDAVAARLKENNESVATLATQSHNQLKVIHRLVNSTLTAALQARLDANKKALALMHQIIEMNRLSGVEPSTDALADIAASEKEVEDLELNIAERTQQDKASMAQLT